MFIPIIRHTYRKVWQKSAVSAKNKPHDIVAVWAKLCFSNTFLNYKKKYIQISVLKPEKAHYSLEEIIPMITNDADTFCPNDSCGIYKVAYNRTGYYSSGFVFTIIIMCSINPGY